jgi:prolyl oligopeptidase PreP (S9A serine peptidase family)
MERPPKLMDSRNNTVKMAILPKTIYRFNALPIKIPTQFFAGTEGKIPIFIYKNKKTQESKKSCTIKELQEASPSLTSNCAT